MRNSMMFNVNGVEMHMMQKDVVWQRIILQDRFGATLRQQGLSLDEIEWPPVMAGLFAHWKKGAICGELMEWPLLAMTSDLNCDMFSLNQIEVSKKWGIPQIIQI